MNADYGKPEPLILEDHMSGWAVVYRRDRTVLIWTLRKKQDAQTLLANIEAAMRYERAAQSISSNPSPKALPSQLDALKLLREFRNAVIGGQVTTQMMERVDAVIFAEHHDPAPKEGK